MKQDTPILIEIDEWYFHGCFIQKNDHPKLLPFTVFTDTKNQEVVGNCYTFAEAKKLCILNTVTEPFIGLDQFLY